MKKYQFIDNKTIITENTLLEEVANIVDNDFEMHNIYDYVFQDTKEYKELFNRQHKFTPEEEEESFYNDYDTLKAEWGEKQTFSVKWYIKNLLDYGYIEEVEEVEEVETLTPEERKQLLKQAKQDYEELKAILEPLKHLSLEEITNILREQKIYTFNLDNEYFDMNYKTLCVTYHYDIKNNNKYLSKFCDIWSIDNIEYHDYNLEEIKGEKTI